MKKKSTIEFCDKCGSIMIPEKKTKNIYLKCRSCGAEKKRNVGDLKIIEKKEKVRGIVVLEKDRIILPMTDKMCPKCENIKAYYWLQQTRSADEPPTQFFRCVKCNHVWREYK
ncbi:MAG: transcription factor S [Candidatus Aenigmatarchaeota archaeon]